MIVPNKDVDFIKNRLRKELESCNTWMINNKLSLHLGKTELMLVGSKTKLKNVDDFNITCLAQEINGVKSVKYLGVQLDQCVSGVLDCKLIIKRKCKVKIHVQKSKRPS